jgi:hypothetical protein
VHSDALLQVLKERSIVIWQVDSVLSHVSSGFSVFSETAIHLKQAPFSYSTTKDHMEVVAVPLWIVPENFNDPGYEASLWAALDLNDDIQRIRNVCLDGSVWRPDATLHHTSCKPRNTLRSRIGVNGRKSTAVSRI